MTIGSVWQTIRRFLFTKTSKEILLFIFFLGLSGIFWLSLTLNETYEKEFAVPVSIVDIPKNTVLTSDEVDTIHVTIRDRKRAMTQQTENCFPISRSAIWMSLTATATA